MEAETPPARAVRLERAANALDGMADAGSVSSAEPILIWVPGRIEFLGKHTDYAGGRSLLCAVERGVYVATRPRRDSRVRTRDARLNESATCALDPELPVSDFGWAVYPTTVARRFARNFPAARTGVDIAFVSDLPVAAGISSSSALVISIFMALAAVNEVSGTEEYGANLRSFEDLASYLGAVENGLDFGSLSGDRGVGTLGGFEDHTAILCARRDALIQFSFCPVRDEGVIAMPKGYRFAVAACGVASEKTAGAMEKYNRLSRNARAAAAAWRSASGRDDATLGDAVRAASADAIRSALSGASVDGFSSKQLVARFDQFHLESEQLVPGAADAISAGDLARLGALVDQSQDAAERLLGNQIPETVALARRARELGAVAASAFGAGFGGSVWALVADEERQSFLARWREQYLAAFPARRDAAQFFVTRAGSPAALLG